MSTEKILEQFEDAYLRGVFYAAEQDSEIKFQDFRKHCAYVAFKAGWQAYRAAIEVELREAFQKGWDASGEGWNAEYPGDCHLKESWQRQRDESLNLKVKP